MAATQALTGVLRPERLAAVTGLGINGQIWTASSILLDYGEQPRAAQVLAQLQIPRLRDTAERLLLESTLLHALGLALGLAARASP